MTGHHSLWEASPAVLPIAAGHDQHHVHGHLWPQPLATRATTARESGKRENPSLCPACFPCGLLAYCNHRDGIDPPVKGVQPKNVRSDILIASE